MTPRAAWWTAALAVGALGGGLVGWQFAGRSRPPTAGAMASPAACAALGADAEPAHPGMVWIPGGQFTMGNDTTFPEEGPAAAASVAGFWMDRTEVTNAQFAEFVAATGHVTHAERSGGSAIFRPRGEGETLRSLVNWWQFAAGADWRHPEGPGSNIVDRERVPVVHVAYEDALAYARWRGHQLPTEAQFEYAAQGGGRRNAAGEYTANTWQGSFPSLNTAADGYLGAAPVGCFAPDRHGAFDLIGNVWEWTTDPYYARHDAADVRRPGGFDPTQPDEAEVAVVKGGSYLCSPDYCMRYRPEARIGQGHTVTTAHIGFRTVFNPPAITQD